MTTPCIIRVAITGSVPQKSDNPAVPITISEQIESTHAASEAGATIAHLHICTYAKMIVRPRRIPIGSPHCKRDYDGIALV